MNKYYVKLKNGAIDWDSLDSVQNKDDGSYEVEIGNGKDFLSYDAESDAIIFDQAAFDAKSEEKQAKEEKKNEKEALFQGKERIDVLIDAVHSLADLVGQVIANDPNLKNSDAAKKLESIKEDILDPYKVLKSNLSVEAEVINK